MQIFVKHVSGTISTLQVAPYDSIEYVKSRIPEISCLNSEDQRLTLFGHNLKNALTLSDYNIKNESTLTIALCLRGGMMAQHCTLNAPSSDRISTQQKKGKQTAIHPDQIQLVIRSSSEQSITITITRDQTVKSLKKNIEEKIKIAVEQQRLLYGGMELESGRSLSEYPLKSDSIIQLATRNTPKVTAHPTHTLIRTVKPFDRSEVQIFVKNLNGKSMTIMISPSDSVESLRAKVEERTGIHASEQRLLFGGKQLEPGKILADYNIQKENTVHLVLRLRGGSIRSADSQYAGGKASVA